MQAPRDENFVPAMLFVGSDGDTYPVEGDENTGRIFVDVPGGGSGTVTSVSVTSANGLAGTVATATTTPAITLSTTITGVLYGNGTAISALTIGSGLQLVGTTLSTTGGGSGTVTSVAMTVPTGLTISGSPVTTTGTLAVALDTGYVIPLSSTLATYVVGPASAADNSIAVYDSTTGKLIKDGGATIATTATVSTVVKRDSNANIFVNNYFANTASTVSAGGTTVLTVASARTQNLTGSSNQTFQLPDATTLSLSSIFEFNNNSSGSLIITNAGAVTQYTIPAGGTVHCYCTSIGTANGTWDFHALAPLAVTWSSGTTGLVMNSVLTTSPSIGSGASSATAPSFIPQRGASTTGFGGDGTNLFATIAGTAYLKVAANSISPNANDATALGTTALQFSDLFLAEGGVINFDNGDVTVTQTNNVLAVSGGDLQVATAGVGTNADSVPTLSSTSTFTNKTLTAPTIGGAALLAENASIDLDPSLSADGTYSGICITGTAGATLAFGDLIYLAAADSRWELVDADSVTTCGAVLTGMCVLAAASDGSATKILLQGNIRADAAFPTLTVGANVYAGLTAGDIVTTAPSATDDVVHVVGKALTADSIYFNPSMDYITIV